MNAALSWPSMGLFVRPYWSLVRVTDWLGGLVCAAISFTGR